MTTPQPYPQLDLTLIQAMPLTDRESFIDITAEAIDPNSPPPDAGPALPQIQNLAERIQYAHTRKASVSLAYGAHLIKNAAAPLLIALIEEGHINHLATQGAGIIHDWEFAHLGHSSESVRDNAPNGTFGTWHETGAAINLSALVGATQNLGLGQSLGHFINTNTLDIPSADSLQKLIADEPTNPLTPARADLLQTILEHDLPPGPFTLTHDFKQFSVTAAAQKYNVPLTVHPGIGYDIFANHPYFSPAAIGRTSGADHRTYAHAIDNLPNGVYLSVGSAIMSPQVFEKAFSAANNIRQQQSKTFIYRHNIVVNDIQDSGNWDWSLGEPPKDNPAYYLRYCKTFHRMGGDIDYIQLDNRTLLHNLLHILRKN